MRVTTYMHPIVKQSEVYQPHRDNHTTRENTQYIPYCAICSPLAFTWDIDEREQEEMERLRYIYTLGLPTTDGYIPQSLDLAMFC